MNGSTQHRIYTVDGYLDLERKRPTANEYLDGQIIPRRGIGLDRMQIALNLVMCLGNQTQDRPIQVYGSSMRFGGRKLKAYFYADIMVVNGKAKCEDVYNDTIINPTVIFEVLSPTNESYQRDVKFGYYRRLDTLCEYLMVAQDEMRVEQYIRRNNEWLLTVADGREAVVHFPSIDCTLTLAELYRKVEFGASNR